MAATRPVQRIELCRLEGDAIRATKGARKGFPCLVPREERDLACLSNLLLTILIKEDYTKYTKYTFARELYGDVHAISLREGVDYVVTRKDGKPFVISGVGEYCGAELYDLMK